MSRNNRNAMKMNNVLIEHYQQQCQAGHIEPDKGQLYVLEYLQSVFHALVQEDRRRHRFLSGLSQPRLVQGLYLWGGVGIGKTYLMDVFYTAIPFQSKMRMHFHQFMHLIHRKMKNLQGKKNPLKIIAKEISQQAMLLCFDEFVVNDIADAVILANLLDELFACGVCLVTTSNILPDELYKRGLQRQLFLPAIELLKKHTKIMHLSTQIDYRTQYLQSAGVFHVPNDAKAENVMQETFNVLTQELQVSSDDLQIFGRIIKTKMQAGNIIWFDFEDICNVPRSQQDYLQIAEDFHTVLLSNVPVISPNARNQIILFIKMIDIFYDAHIRLIVSAETSIDQLYTQGTSLFEYQRTCSRLTEMQSKEYYAS